MNVKCIKNPYTGTADKTLLNQIEQNRPEADDHSLAEFWQVGSAICERKPNGFYHVYALEKDPFYGKILRDYVLSRDGKLRDTDRFYEVPTKESYIKWLAERNIRIEEV